MELIQVSERARLFGKLLNGARGRANKTNRLFDLEGDFVEELYQRQGGRCAVTGVEFDLEVFPDAFVKHPYAPSIDRKLPGGGYTRDNVRLVCAAVNFGMGQWGEEVFLVLARAAVVLDREKTTTATSTLDDWEAQQRERIAAAESVLDKLPPTERAKQESRIRGLKAALRKGPERMREIAVKAADKRRANAAQRKASQTAM